nr:MAG TPA: hypothetical protein [Caudoviricetes sp.]
MRRWSLFIFIFSQADLFGALIILQSQIFVGFNEILSMVCFN